eukprot:5519164-Pyramimonas_sp.AAC.1
MTGVSDGMLHDRIQCLTTARCGQQRGMHKYSYTCPYPYWERHAHALTSARDPLRSPKVLVSWSPRAPIVAHKACRPERLCEGISLQALRQKPGEDEVAEDGH